MKTKTFSIIIISLIIFAGQSLNALAAPLVNSALGSFIHGQDITISGSGFGTKNPAAPLYWNDYETGTVDTPGLSTASIASGGMGFNYIWDAWSGDASLNIYGDPRSIIRNQSSAFPWPGVPHSRSTKLISGAHVDTLYLARKNSDHLLWTVCAPAKSKRWFMSAYYRLGSNMEPADIYSNRNILSYSIQLAEDVDATETQIDITGTHAVKVSGAYSGDTLLIDSEYVHVTGKTGNTITVERGCDNVGSGCTGTGSAHSNNANVYMRGQGWNHKIGSACGVDGTGYNGAHFQSFGLEANTANTTDWNPFWAGGGAMPCAGCTSDPTRYTKDAHGNWLHLETRLYEDANPGKSLTSIDNLVSQNCTCTSGEYWAADDVKCINIGHYASRSFCQPLSGSSCGDAGARATDEAWVYMDDVYIDNSLSRVVLANNQNYNQATITEPQIPSAWADGSITAKVNLGKLPDSGTAYVFVFDSNNQPNSVGYPVTLGSSGGDTTPPAAPTGLSVI